VGVGPQLRVGAVEERAQGGAGGVGLVAGELLAGQGEAQGRVVRVGAQQVGEVGDGEQVAAPGFDGAALEGRVGHHQDEDDRHHDREQGQAAGARTRGRALLPRASKIEVRCRMGGSVVGEALVAAGGGQGLPAMLRVQPAALARSNSRGACPARRKRMAPPLRAQPASRALAEASMGSAGGVG
jgi:hypothetical protein